MAYDWKTLDFDDMDAGHLLFDPELINLFVDAFEEKVAALDSSVTGGFNPNPVTPGNYARPDEGNNALAGYRSFSGGQPTVWGWADLQSAVNELGRAYVRYAEANGTPIDYEGRPSLEFYGPKPQFSGEVYDPEQDHSFRRWLMRRCWPREVWALANPGEAGQVARFIATDFPQGFGIRPLTPVDERGLSGRIVRHDGGDKWIVVDEFDPLNWQGPDVIEGFGLLRPQGIYNVTTDTNQPTDPHYATADIFGVWIAADIYRAINLMRWTNPASYWSNRCEAARRYGFRYESAGDHYTNVHFETAGEAAAAFENRRQQAVAIYSGSTAPTNSELGFNFEGPTGPNPYVQLPATVGTDYFFGFMRVQGTIPGLTLIQGESLPWQRPKYQSLALSMENLHGVGKLQHLGGNLFRWRPPRATEFGPAVHVAEDRVTVLHGAGEPMKRIGISYRKPSLMGGLQFTVVNGSVTNTSGRIFTSFPLYNNEESPIGAYVEGGRFARDGFFLLQAVGGDKLYLGGIGIDGQPLELPEEGDSGRVYTADGRSWLDVRRAFSPREISIEFAADLRASPMASAGEWKLLKDSGTSSQSRLFLLEMGQSGFNAYAAVVQRQYAYPHIDDLPQPAVVNRTIEFYVSTGAEILGDQYDSFGDPDAVPPEYGLHRVQTIGLTVDRDIRGRRIGQLEPTPNLWPEPKPGSTNISPVGTEVIRYHCHSDYLIGYAFRLTTIVKWDVPGGFRYIVD
ncbi:MAG TPA: hypothetical protein VGN72_19790 [Tepidisphaeraceae bacterium]|jgi:hypothetical protein|nr:hypothetical protein [Tepidisphaeraceae bacterium]